MGEVRSFHDDTWVIVPVFNESEVLKSVLLDLQRHFSNIVVVDDASTDNSQQITESMGVKYLRHPINLGQGASLRTGLEFVRRMTDATLVATFDGDGQHNAADLVDMINILRTSGSDAVLGSRFLGKESTNVPRFRSLVLRLLVSLRKTFLRVKLSDVHNGLRVFSLKSFDHFTIKHDRMAHASEFTKYIRQNKLQCVECAVTIRYTSRSKAKGQHLLEGISVVFDLVRK